MERITLSLATFKIMALDQQSVLLIATLIKNVHTMAGVRCCSACITFTTSEGSRFTESGHTLFLACQWTFWLPVGLPLRDGITEVGRTVSTVLPGDCWQCLLNRVMSKAELVLKVM